MSLVKINYFEVHTKAAQLRSQIFACLNEMETEYRQIQSRLNSGVDGTAAAAVCSAMDENRKKSYEVAETLDKLLSFMANSANQVEIEELKIASTFHSSARKNNKSGG